LAFLAAAAPVLGAIGAATSAIGAISQGMSSAAEARYGAAIASNNQIIANQKAAYTSAAGETTAYDVGLRARGKAGEQTAALAAEGLDVNTGSARDVRASQAGLNESEQVTTRADAALKAYGYRSAATSFGADAQLKRAEAPLDVGAGFLKAGGTLLSGASNLGFKWGGLGTTYPTVGDWSLNGSN
jgi:hypothetical protein